MYDFDNGKIRLDRISGEYVVLVDGEPVEERTDWTDSQRRNPRLAISRFTNVISEYLNRNVESYLTDHNKNAVMGCNINTDCTTCRIKGLNIEGSNCILGGGPHGKDIC